MSHIIFSPLSIDDMGRIWDYTAETWGVDQADFYTDKIRDACHDLAVADRQGRKVDIRDGYFKYAVGRHFIFYRISDAGIIVVRILHQSRDVERHL